MSGRLDRIHYEGNPLDAIKALTRRIDSLERAKWGGAGSVYGACYGDHIGWSQAAAVQNTWYNVSDADMIDGSLLKCTHDGSGKLTVEEPGNYLVVYSCSYSDDTVNDHLEVGIEVSGSGSAESEGITHSENAFANQEEHLSGGTILQLGADATVEVAIRTTDAGGPTISIQGVNLSVIVLGGI